MSKFKKTIMVLISLAVVMGIIQVVGMRFFIYNVGKECTEGILFANECIDTIAETQSFFYMVKQETGLVHMTWHKFSLI